MLNLHVSVYCMFRTLSFKYFEHGNLGKRSLWTSVFSNEFLVLCSWYLCVLVVCYMHALYVSLRDILHLFALVIKLQ